MGKDLKYTIQFNSKDENNVKAAKVLDSVGKRAKAAFIAEAINAYVKTNNNNVKAIDCKKSDESHSNHNLTEPPKKIKPNQNDNSINAAVAGAGAFYL